MPFWHPSRWACKACHSAVLCPTALRVPCSVFGLRLGWADECTAHRVRFHLSCAMLVSSLLCHARPSGLFQTALTGCRRRFCRGWACTAILMGMVLLNCMRRLVLPRVRRLGLTPPQHRRLCHEDTRKPVTESSPQNLWAMVRRRATPLERHLAATALSILQLGFVANIEATPRCSAGGSKVTACFAIGCYCWMVE